MTIELAVTPIAIIIVITVLIAYALLAYMIISLFRKDEEIDIELTDEDTMAKISELARRTYNAEYFYQSRVIDEEAYKEEKELIQEELDEIKERLNNGK